MACYISSNNNRFYVGLEGSYGTVPALTSNSRIPALQLSFREQVERVPRRDKIGGRTFAGYPAGLRKTTNYTLKTLLTGWIDQQAEPAYGPLFQAAFGSPAQMFAGGTVASASNGLMIQFAGPHGLSAGQAIVYGGEIRFVEAVLDPQTITLSSPFTQAPGSGAQIQPTATYVPAEKLPSVSIFDYWSPDTAVQRILSGAAVDKMRIKVNADYHEFEFSGPAKSMMDNVSFSSGQGALTAFPSEPPDTGTGYSIIPGHLGQAWVGEAATQFYTITSAEITIDNDVDLRAREFGSEFARCISAGERNVYISFSLYSQDNAANNNLYAAARQGSPVPMMFQLGQQTGQLFGVYLKSVKFEVPDFVDSDRKLEWEFVNCRAEGAINDEIYVAFG
jgi:hypothetical protein